MTTTTTTNPLQHLEQRAVQAHNWTSFSPEKRGQQLVNDYGNELLEDLAELQAAGVSEELISNYKSRYENIFNSWISAKGRCASSMITGPANFNVRRAEKANRSEDNHYRVFREWRKKAKASCIRKMQPVKTFVSEIDRYRNELAGMQKNHELMKEGNKRIKEARKTGEDLTEYLTNTFCIKPHMIEWTLKFGFGLANNNANMKRVEMRIKVMESKEKARKSNLETAWTFEGGTVILSYELDRVLIKHDEKPAANVLSELKSNGFNWSPFNKAWMRKITMEAIYKTEKLTGVKITK